MSGKEPIDRSGYLPENVPDDRCGYTTEYIDLLGPESANNVTCWRENWKNHDCCIWHVDTFDKPGDELAEQKIDGLERLDGTILSGAKLADKVDLADCTLREADITDANFQRADFRDANLYEADLSDTDFEKANFANARLQDADLINTVFRGANLANSDFLWANLTDANLDYADLTDAIFPNADFTNASLYSAYLTGSDLSEANLTNSVLSEANLVKADFQWGDLTDAYFVEADLTDANLSRTHLDSTDFTDADLTSSNFEHATLTETSLGAANLEDTRLYAAELRDVYVNESTEFGRSGYEAEVFDHVPTIDNPSFPENSRFAGIYRWLHTCWRGLRHWWYWLRLDEETREEHAELFDKAASDYRTIRRLHEENDMPHGVGTFTVRAREADRRQALAEHAWRRWLWLAGSRWSCKHGESPKQVIYASLTVILLFGVLYSLFGGIHMTPEDDEPLAFDFLPTLSVSTPEWLEILLGNLYFSAVTFSTLGYGDVEPASGAVQFLASVQSITGAALMALLVAVLARRITR